MHMCSFVPQRCKSLSSIYLSDRMCFSASALLLSLGDAEIFYVRRNVLSFIDVADLFHRVIHVFRQCLSFIDVSELTCLAFLSQRYAYMRFAKVLHSEM